MRVHCDTSTQYVAITHVVCSRRSAQSRLEGEVDFGTELVVSEYVASALDFDCADDVEGFAIHIY